MVTFQKVGPKGSFFGKLFTRVLNNRLTFWAESYGILIEEQGGFREKNLPLTTYLYSTV